MISLHKRADDMFIAYEHPISLLNFLLNFLLFFHFDFFHLFFHEYRQVFQLFIERLSQFQGHFLKLLNFELGLFFFRFKNRSLIFHQWFLRDTSDRELLFHGLLEQLKKVLATGGHIWIWMGERPQRVCFRQIPRQVFRSQKSCQRVYRGFNCWHVLILRIYWVRLFSITRLVLRLLCVTRTD